MRQLQLSQNIYCILTECEIRYKGNDHVYHNICPNFTLFICYLYSNRLVNYLKTKNPVT